MTEQQLDLMRRELDATRDALSSLIAWVASSAGSPISWKEAEILLNKMSVTQSEGEPQR